MTTAISITALTAQQAADLREIAAWGLADRAHMFIECSSRFGGSTSSYDDEARLADAVRLADSLAVGESPHRARALDRRDLTTLREMVEGIVVVGADADDAPGRPYWGALLATAERGRAIVEALEATLPSVSLCECCGRPYAGAAAA
ncbi:hypothetical protein [Miltoncostaea marina]|uniref:hypothetical protein n=1 Tax=Miltoncostaea marina TaxID=2843215 RepID=UPI001C3DC8EA|nr:hypothetical protein [Miltoncostaea marina]